MRFLHCCDAAFPLILVPRKDYLSMHEQWRKPKPPTRRFPRYAAASDNNNKREGIWVMYDGTSFKPLAADTADGVIAVRRPYNRDEIDALVRHAHGERNAALTEAIAGAIAGVVLWFRARREKAVALRELRELDPRTLADIGVTRSELSELIYGAHKAGPVLRGQMLVDFVENKLLRPYRTWRLTARTRNELSALDDTALRDIGIKRGQIDGIAATVASAKLDGKPIPVAAAPVLGGFEPRTAANSNLFAPRQAVDAAD